MHSFLFYSSLSLAIATATMAAGCADSATAQNPPGSPVFVRNDHTTAASDPGGGQATESKTKSRVAERRTVEAKSSRGGDKGPTRPVDRPTPRTPPPRPPR